MQNNNVRKLKNLFKNCQRAGGSYSKNVSAEFAKLGFYHCIYINHTNIFRLLSKLTSKQKRALFRVGRAMAKKGKYFDVFMVLSIITHKDRKNRLYGSRMYDSFIDSFDEKHPCGDFRLIPNMEEVVYKTKDPQEIEVSKNLFRLNSLYCKWTFNKEKNKYELCYNGSAGNKKLILSCEKNLINFLFNQ